MLAAHLDKIVAQLFQSAPGREAGRCPRRIAGWSWLQSFNPRPAVRPGDARSHLTRARLTLCFNPRPAVRPGDACGHLRLVGAVLAVSIRARP